MRASRAWKTFFSAEKANTAAYYGQLRDAREFSRRAEDSAESVRRKRNLRNILCPRPLALREALFGNAGEARQRAALAIGRSRQAVMCSTGLRSPWRMPGDDIWNLQSTLTDDLGKRFPQDTIVQFELPANSPRARLAVSQGKCFRGLLWAPEPPHRMS